ncbi:hypothetical protein ACJMK2_018292 [Sinanodonta woodiana]|uniref:Transglutaminase-like domain-containing protein n=1 Tax=Sinanodonta woodiana TaxID=1069815 RepID=A0ABD3UEG8_SINWO
MGCGVSVDVYVSSNDNTNSTGVGGCFVGCCAFGKLRHHTIPLIKPPGENKKMIVQSPFMFHDIDEYARLAPEEVTQSIKTLVAYLIQPCNSDLEKVRSFYVWIANHISYDKNYAYGRKETPNDPMTVLRNRVANASEGYANLLSAMCRSANIPVKKLKGFAKGEDYDPEHPFSGEDDPEHSWNAVYVNNDWRFVDTAWGSGYTDDIGQFHKQYEEFWFLTDPENFINDHFPYLKNDPRTTEMWQLLKKPISLEQYIRTVKTETATKDWGVELSHKEPIIVFRKEIHILVHTTIIPLVAITATLDTSDKINMDAYVAVFKDREDQFKVLVRPPSPGVYILKVYGKREGDTTNANPGLVKYILKCTDMNNLVKNFPISYTAAQTYQCCLLEPTHRDLEADAKVRFRVTSPYLLEIMVEDTPLEKVDDFTWEGDYITPRRVGTQLGLYGNTSENSDFRKHQILYKFNIV